MKALVLTCTLKRSPDPSHTEAPAGVVGEPVREGDAWPHAHAKPLNAQLLVVASPTWLGRSPATGSRAWSSPATSTGCTM
ncbi:hypothetical protein [Streptomyces griseorubiginosus]|uniref:hypothetical protein n=1 Tax=Streptomyces griseorubiginosus TaxID=67304 RepID=UPI0033C0DD03